MSVINLNALVCSKKLLEGERYVEYLVIDKGFGFMGLTIHWWEVIK